MGGAGREAEVCEKWKAGTLLSQLTLPVQVETLIENFSDMPTRGKLAPLVETDKGEEDYFVGIKDSIWFKNDDSNVSAPGQFICTASESFVL